MELKLLLNLGTGDARRLGLEKTKMAGDVVDVEQGIADELLKRGWAASVEDEEEGEPLAPDASATPQPSSSRPGPTPSASNPDATVQVGGGGAPGVEPTPTPDFDSMSDAELKAFADANKIQGVRANMPKDEMVRVIRKHQGK